MSLSPQQRSDLHELLASELEVDRDGLFDLLCYLSIVAPSSRRDADETIARLAASATQRACRF